ncbi:hypothetical protein B4U80_14589, partial [Leptotrombidium deliense]
ITSNSENESDSISYACRNNANVLLGDATRKCESNRWTGTQPFCIPPELVKFYCGYANDDTRCNFVVPANTEELRGEQSKSSNCQKLVDSLTTIRLNEKRERNLNSETTVSYACENDYYVMLGDETRMCEANGQWSGIQPFCMPPELVQKYCGYASDDVRCTNIRSVNIKKERMKRRTLLVTKPAAYSFETNEMNSTSDIICIGFTKIRMLKCT